MLKFLYQPDVECGLDYIWYWGSGSQQSTESFEDQAKLKFILYQILHYKEQCFLVPLGTVYIQVWLHILHEMIVDSKRVVRSNNAQLFQYA
jgi:hypothetical protein